MSEYDQLRKAVGDLQEKGIAPASSTAVESVESVERKSPLAVAKSMLQETFSAENVVKVLESVLNWAQTDKWAGIKVMAAYNAALIIPPVVQNWDKVQQLLK